MKEKVTRIKKMEQKYDRFLELLEKYNSDELKELKRLGKQLNEYYTSKSWKEDYEADEQGNLPSDLKRGVLSQDGLYDALKEYDTLLNILKK